MHCEVSEGEDGVLSGVDNVVKVNEGVRGWTETSGAFEDHTRTGVKARCKNFERGSFGRVLVVNLEYHYGVPSLK